MAGELVRLLETNVGDMPPVKLLWEQQRDGKNVLIGPDGSMDFISDTAEGDVITYLFGSRLHDQSEFTATSLGNGAYEEYGAGIPESHRNAARRTLVNINKLSEPPILSKRSGRKAIKWTLDRGIVVDRIDCSDAFSPSLVRDAVQATGMETGSPYIAIDNVRQRLVGDSRDHRFIGHRETRAAQWDMALEILFFLLEGQPFTVAEVVESLRERQIHSYAPIKVAQLFYNALSVIRRLNVSPIVEKRPEREDPDLSYLQPTKKPLVVEAKFFEPKSIEDKYEAYLRGYDLVHPTIVPFTSLEITNNYEPVSPVHIPLNGVRLAGKDRVSIQNIVSAITRAQVGSEVDSLTLQRALRPSRTGQKNIALLRDALKQLVDDGKLKPLGDGLYVTQ